MDFLTSLEGSGFAIWIRESGSLFAYPGALTVHTLGLAMLVGGSAFVDLRMLGVGRRMPLGRLLGVFPTMWTGLGINAVSGVILFIADATRKAVQPIFYVKLFLIVLAVLTMAKLKRIIRDDGGAEGEPSGVGRALAMISLALWIGAITAGRLMAYFNNEPPALIPPI